MFPVRCRPDYSHLAIAAFFAAIGVAGVWSSLSALPVALLFGATLILPSLGLAVWTLTRWVEARDDGLYWHGGGFVPWTEIADFYDQSSADGRKQKSPTMVIAFASSRPPLRLTSDWKHRDALRDAIAARAVNARTREWGVLGARDIDTPFVFDYRTADNRVLPFVLAACVGLPIAGAVAVAPKVAAMFVEVGFWWGVGLTATLCATFGLPLAFVAILLPSQREVRRRMARGERIVVDDAGLTLERDGQTVQRIAWADLDRVEDEPLGRFGFRAVAVARGGERIVFSRTIAGFRLLTQRIARHLPPQPTLPVAERQTFRYRCATNRALLWFPTALALTPLVRGDWKTAGVLSLGAAWMWWRYAAAKIEATPDGLTQNAPFGTRHLAWRSVATYREIGDLPLRFGIVDGRRTGEKIVFWLGIDGVDALRATIAERAPEGVAVAAGERPANPTTK